jgi:hypothetical protein
MSARWSRLRVGRRDGDSMLVAVSDWMPLTLSGGVASVIGCPEPAYFIDPFGVVHCRGYLAGVSGTVCVLPNGARPAGTEVFSSVTVLSDGTVSAAAMPCSLSGVTFRPHG